MGEIDINTRISYLLIFLEYLNNEKWRIKMDYKKRNYLTCAIVFITFAILINGFILFGEMSNSDSYITFGVGRIEWLFSSNMMSIAIFGAGIMSLYLGLPGFTKLFVKLLGKKQQIGIVPEEELSSRNHLLKLWGRALIMAFFIANIAYTLSANETLVQFMLTPEGETDMINQYGKLLTPDPLLMMHLIWMLAIPLSFLLVPIWIMMDVGLVSAKKVKGADFSSVNLTTSRLYKIIKGYAGIGFIYNFVILIVGWTFDRDTPTQPINMVIQLLVPLILISCAFPLVILMDHQKERFKKQFEKTIVKLNMNKELKCTVELIDRR